MPPRSMRVLSAVTVANSTKGKVCALCGEPCTGGWKKGAHMDRHTRKMLVELCRCDVVAGTCAFKGGAGVDPYRLWHEHVPQAAGMTLHVLWGKHAQPLLPAARRE